MGSVFFTFWEGESYIRLEVHSLFIFDALRDSNIKHKIHSPLNYHSWLGAHPKVGESVENKEEAGEEKEDKEPDAGCLRDDGGGDDDMEDSLYAALLVVQLEGEGAGVDHPEAGDVEVSRVAVTLTVVP